jgi:hypothetical protein
MKFIDHLRTNPICFNDDTDKCDFDASPLIYGATCFDISEVADQLIDKIEVIPDGGWEVHYTGKGKELRKLTTLGHLDKSHYVGIIPPSDNCWFEYRTAQYGGDTVECGIYLRSYLESG